MTPSLRGMANEELDELISRLEVQTRYRAESHLGRRLVDQLLNALTAKRRARERGNSRRGR